MNFRHLDHIVEQFFDFKELPKFSVLSQGHINDTFSFQIGERTFILQKINRNVFRSPEILMRNMVIIAEYLQQNSTLEHLLFPVFNKQGMAYAQDLEGAFWRVLPFIDNSYAPDTVQHTSQAFEVARMLGNFLQALHGLKPSKIQDTIPDFHNSINRYAVFDQVLGRAPLEKRRLAKSCIFAVRQYYPLFKQITSLPLPRRIVHNDPKISNVLFSKSDHQALCIIDWDTIMPGSLLSDFGDMVRTACASGNEEVRQFDQIFIKPEYFRACCDGFLPQVHSMMTETEHEHLLDGVKWIVLEQSLRFLTDYLDGDQYYKISYPEQNLVRANNQMALYRSILEQEEELLTILQQSW